MLSINVSHAKPFLSYPYEEVLCPRLERAQRELLNGGGKGDDFIGWVRLPAQYDRAEYARILAAAKKIQGDSKALVVIGIGGSYLGARGVIECLCSPNYNLKKIGEMVDLKIPLTTYVARHTWASVALHMNIPIATISEGMGHNSYKTTQIYLESIDVATINEANKKIIQQVITARF